MDGNIPGKIEMEMKERIIKTLVEVADALQNITSEWYIIGSSAMILSDIEIGKTFDIDILTTHRGSDEIQQLLSRYQEQSPTTKEDDLFRSNFARFHLPLMDVEVMGSLQIKRNDIWHDVHVNDFNEISIEDIVVKVPTLKEQKRILLLFGRDKDIKRVNQFLNFD